MLESVLVLDVLGVNTIRFNYATNLVDFAGQAATCDETGNFPFGNKIKKKKSDQNGKQFAQSYLSRNSTLTPKEFAINCNCTLR